MFRNVDIISLARAFTRTATCYSLYKTDVNSCEWLKMSIHEKNMRPLNIHKSGCWVFNLGITSPHTLNLQQTLIQECRSHKHTVLFTVIGNQLENRYLPLLFGS
jgi:hypothetical protein